MNCSEPTAQLVEAFWPVPERDDDQHGPFVANAGEHLADRAAILRRVQIAWYQRCAIRPVKRIIDTREFDPFLLLDDFRNERLEDYRAGFPRHPRCGIETITYVLADCVDHGDSLGNRGKLGAGDVHMTAGSGILHQEMPQGDPEGRMHGFQHWANLPSSLKMTAPRYQDIKAAEIPESVVKKLGTAAN